MLRLAAVLLASVTLLVPAAARACSVCGCGDPLVLAGDSMPVASTMRFALEYEYLTATARSDDQPDRTESLTQMTLRPVVVYSPVERLNLVLANPARPKGLGALCHAIGGARGRDPHGTGRPGPRGAGSSSGTPPASGPSGGRTWR